MAENMDLIDTEKMGEEKVKNLLIFTLCLVLPEIIK